MQQTTSESQNILILALSGSILSGIWLAYRLNFFRFYSYINDEKRILFPSFLFIVSPFLVPFLFSHPLPGALPSLIPFATFMLGVSLAESNNNKTLSGREKELIHQIHRKLSDNNEKAKQNDSCLTNYIKKNLFPAPLHDLSPLENIKDDLIKLESLQVIIQPNLRLATDNLIIYANDCAELIDKFNKELKLRIDIGNEIKIDPEAEARSIITKRTIDKKLLSLTKDFLEDRKNFFEEFLTLP